MSNPRSVVLLSGGIDSTSLIAHYVSIGVAVHALFVDWSQPAAERERLASRAIAEHYALELTELNVSGFNVKVPGEIVGRNAMLLTSALIAFPRADLVGIGVHGGTGYTDCSPEFIATMQGVFDVYRHGEQRVDAPFVGMSKGEVFRLGRATSAPLSLTYSCEVGRLPPCASCRSCTDKQVLWSSQDIAE